MAKRYEPRKWNNPAERADSKRQRDADGKAFAAFIDDKKGAIEFFT